MYPSLSSEQESVQVLCSMFKKALVVPCPQVSDPRVATEMSISKYSNYKFDLSVLPFLKKNH